MSSLATQIASRYKASIVREALKKPVLIPQGSVFSAIERTEPHAAQRHLLSEQARFNVAVCGRRFGKTALTTEIMLPALERGMPVAYFAPTYKMLSPVWRELRRVFHTAIAKVNVQEKLLEFRNGATLDFWSLDRYDSVRGRKYATTVLDEAAAVRNLEEAWLQVIRPTLTDYVGSAWFLSTPKGMNYFHELHQHGAAGKQGWKSWQSNVCQSTHCSRRN
jgi:hypothetical protein